MFALKEVHLSHNAASMCSSAQQLSLLRLMHSSGCPHDAFCHKGTERAKKKKYTHIPDLHRDLTMKRDTPHTRSTKRNQGAAASEISAGRR